MPADIATQVRELIERSQGMEYGPLQVKLAEQAVHLADAHADLDLGFEARAWLIESATFSEMKEHAFAPFAWSLAQYDRDPERFADNSLLWQYKWIITGAMAQSRFSSADLDAMIDDMERRYQAAGLSLYVVVKFRLDLARLKGNADKVRELFQRLRKMRRDGSADCRACICDWEIIVWLFLGEDRRAVAAARPILRGELSCRPNVPRISLARVLQPMFRLRRFKQAMECHRRWFTLAGRRRGTRLVEEAYENIDFLTMTKNHARAIRILESHFPYPAGPLGNDHADPFFLFLSARFLFEQLAESGRSTVKLRLDESFPAHRADGVYETRALQTWFEAEARRIAAVFDSKNGTESFAEQVTKHLNLKDDIHPYPLTKA